MLIKLSRILLIVLVILLAAIYIPYFYWISFGERNHAPYVQYSPVIEKFVIFKYFEEKYYDEDNKIYSREETDELLPLSNYRLLASKGLMPDSLQGKEITIEEVRLNSIHFKIKSEYINAPQIPLYPLFESAPARLKLEMPDEFFRTTDRIEFISTETNEINPDLTNTFTEAMTAKGFHFPAKKCFGNPTTRKPFDEGYFIIDSHDKLYHLKMIKGKPFCEKISSTDHIKIKTFFLREIRLKEFYGYLISEDNRLFLIMYDNYKLQEIPIENYNADEDMIRFQGNLFYRLISVYKNDKINVYVTNRDYELIGVYSESWQGREDRIAGAISHYIFPFDISLTSTDSMYINFYFSNFSFSSIYLNILFIIISVIWFGRKKINIKSNALDFIIILFTGIYGFIGISVFKNN